MEENTVNNFVFVVQLKLKIKGLLECFHLMFTFLHASKCSFAVEQF